jgi:hypothetical protein
MIQLYLMADTYESTIGETAEARGFAGWLLLIHQLPADPAYLRVKVLRRLKRVGSVALKSSVYLLPDRDEAREDFHWIRQEIVDAGGEATVSAARFLEGTSGEELEHLFNRERDQEYAELTASATALAEREALAEADVERLWQRLGEIRGRDYFDAAGRAEAERTVRGLAGRLKGESMDDTMPKPEGATWVTRAGVKIDRMASAWLIRRFIDPRARFKFVPPSGYEPKRGEITFDMFEGGITHEEDRCTFEALIRRFGLNEPALGPIAEIVHELDCKDGKFERVEAPGVASIVRGIAAAHARDEDRLAASTHVFEGLLARFGMQDVA